MINVGGGDLVSVTNPTRSFGKMSSRFLKMPEAGCDLRLHRLRMPRGQGRA
jgi:hypothetical protein